MVVTAFRGELNRMLRVEAVRIQNVWGRVFVLGKRLASLEREGPAHRRVEAACHDGQDICMALLHV